MGYISIRFIVISISIVSLENLMALYLSKKGIFLYDINILSFMLCVSIRLLIDIEDNLIIRLLPASFFCFLTLLPASRFCILRKETLYFFNTIKLKRIKISNIKYLEYRFDNDLLSGTKINLIIGNEDGTNEEILIPFTFAGTVVSEIAALCRKNIVVKYIFYHQLLFNIITLSLNAVFFYYFLSSW